MFLIGLNRLNRLTDWQTDWQTDTPSYRALSGIKREREKGGGRKEFEEEEKKEN